MADVLGRIEAKYGWRFKSGSSGSSDAPEPTSSTMDTTADMQYARDTLYPNIANGLNGNGYGPTSLLNLRKSDAYKGLSDSYTSAQSDLTSNLNRSVKSGDSRVKNFAQNQLARDYTSAKDNVAGQFRQELIDDQDYSMGLASDTLGQEQRMAIQSTGQYNQALAQNNAFEQQYGTFGTNLAGGLAEGAASMYFAQGMSK